ncbi:MULTISPECIES: iron uptake transporter permease EfeU [unclassified Rhodococcus (in: high G+C Gram-positive bacteria)]|uniref:iron uptake transporter permease EfeU n=1 Tax=unclassified Rhodococcus (in: high G+C Gram-positive bacteria) TaxID=192944 RepID=UPI00163B5369|nr:MULTISPECIES: iron uptake transporter permease EfeU [unclassified Rhodococcus (in: high G+C Gram-positive bacteria)]MBC2643004.1 FTR1 family protein [Rhodococcus sp. 3A]MBC2892254.1 FTR1 family protein [Rhodococcus sp. 4CII]
MSVLAAGTATAPSIATQLFGSGLIGLREGLEAGIVVMILAAFLVKAQRRDALKWVWLGVGVAVAMVAAIFLVIHYGTSTVAGLTAEIIAGVASLVAVAIVTAMVLWMRKAARTISHDLEAGMEKALVAGPVAVLTLAFFAVGREGVETALLMVGYAENTAGSVWPLIGLLLGIVAAAVLTVLLYFGAVRLDFAKFFKYTGVFLIIVAAGILGYGVHALQVGGVLPGGSALAFDISDSYDASGWYGTVLAGIFNFRPDPTILQAVAWIVYVVVVLFLFLRPASPPKPAPTAGGSSERTDSPSTTPDETVS